MVCASGFTNEALCRCAEGKRRGNCEKPCPRGCCILKSGGRWSCEQRGYVPGLYGNGARGKYSTKPEHTLQLTGMVRADGSRTIGAAMCIAKSHTDGHG